MCRNCCLIILFSLSFVLQSFAQVKPILLTESSFVVKNRNSENFYFGLKAGDILTFSIEISSSIRQVSVEEYNGGTLFELSNPDSISNHSITIEHDGIYFISFFNSGFLAGKRHCFLKAFRTPSNVENVKFNTTVYWEERQDTIKYMVTENYLKGIDTLIMPIVNESVHLSKKGLSKSANIMFTLPDSCSNWSYFVSSDKRALELFSEAESKFAINSSVVRKYGLMAGIAINGVASFTPNAKCKSFEYGFVFKKMDEHVPIQDSVNGLASLKLTCLDFGRVRNLKRNPNYLVIRNTSNKSSTVHVRITAVMFKEIWDQRQIEKTEIKTSWIPYLKN